MINDKLKSEFYFAVYDCFQRWRAVKDQCWADCVGDGKTVAEAQQQTAFQDFPMKLPVHATFSWVEHDEDQLFGRTIVSMLRSLPLTERNRLKVHIFTLVAKAQCEIENTEYLV